MNLATLRAEGLTCRRGDQTLFEHLGFEVAAGELVWLRGHNGRGKTSLLRLLAGLARPDQGRITWDGVAISEAPGFSAQRVYIAHANALKDDLNVFEALQFLAVLHGRDGSVAAVQDALHLLGMRKRQRAPIRTLSQGQRRRVALARLALETSPSLWVLDEPFDALDVEGIDVVNGLLTRHLERGGSTVLTSHQPLTLAGVAPRCLELVRAA